MSPSEVKAEQPGWSTYASLHKRVARHLKYVNLDLKFHDPESSAKTEHQENGHIMGHFKCLNETCKSDGWASKKIAIWIQMYKGHKYNATVYHQRCKACNSLGRPNLNDKSYARRVAYWLKKWCRIKMPEKGINQSYVGRSRRPHLSDFCEGCKAGHCIQLVKKK